MKDRLIIFVERAVGGAVFWLLFGFVVWFFDEVIENVGQQKVHSLREKCVEMREMPLGACSKLFGEDR